jgi:nucleoside-diphosphate-sugar epimerase
MRKSALVIGATGLVGYGVVRELVEAQYDVTGMARGKTHAVPFPANIPVQHFDRTRDEDMQDVFKDKRWDVVVDCAAFHPPEIEAMLKIIPKHIGHYFFISTDFVYTYDPAGTFPTREDDPKVIAGPGVPSYALDKWHCEQLLLRAGEDDHMPLTVLRPPHVLGAGKPLGCDPVMGRAANLLDHMKAGKPVPVLVEGKLLIQPIYSREIGRAIVHMAGNPRTWGQVFNMAGEECVMTAQYYRLIAKALNIPLSISTMSHAQFLREHPDRSPFCRHRCYDLSHLRTLTNYKHFYTIDEAIAETLAWMQQQTETAAA